MVQMRSSASQVAVQAMEYGAQNDRRETKRKKKEGFASSPTVELVCYKATLTLFTEQGNARSCIGTTIKPPPEIISFYLQGLLHCIEY